MKLFENKARNEFKYLLSAQQARAVEEYLKKIQLKRDVSQGDCFVPAGGYYVITSLYFDTPLLEDYRDKLSGLKHRRKLRARVYKSRFDDSNNAVFLEIKEKHDMHILKRRGSVSPAQWSDFAGGSKRFDARGLIGADKSKLERFAYLLSRKNYQPHVVVRYKRKAFMAQFISDIRITLDSDIEACRWADFVYNNMVSVYAGKSVLEVKFFGALPWWFKDMAYRFHLSRQAFSKYTNAVDALNRYNPIAR